MHYLCRAFVIFHLCLVIFLGEIKMGEKYKFCEFCDLGDYATIGNTCIEYMKKRTIHQYHCFYGRLFFSSFGRILIVIRIKCYDKIMCRLFDLHLKAPPPLGLNTAFWLSQCSQNLRDRAKVSNKDQKETCFGRKETF